MLILIDKSIKNKNKYIKMQFLYLILLTTSILCSDLDVFSNPNILIAKYKLLESIKTEINFYPLPSNYKDYLEKLDSSLDFILDAIPIEDWEEESKKLFLLANNKKEENSSLLLQLENATNSNDYNFTMPYDSSATNLYINKFIDFKSKLVTTSKGKYVVFYFIKAMTVAIFKDNVYSEVKVCTTTHTVFAKCSNYNSDEAAKGTAKAYTYSKIKESLEAFD